MILSHRVFLIKNIYKYISLMNNIKNIEETFYTDTLKNTGKKE